MSISRREFMIKSAAAGAAALLWAEASKQGHANSALGQGPYDPTWESLGQYKCPEWFRDAKFGLWAHWSAQCVPEQGDWWAQRMYHQGSDAYNYFVAHYGQPNKLGFKEVDRDWKAENWDPEAMMKMYKAAGAKYFVALANHHDNFDTWDSKYQPWNSTRVGPMKNIIGMWAKEARKNGLRFGVTVHASHTWNWFEVTQGADSTGPYAGVPYDGKLTKEDGAGTWWGDLGLDPQDLYAQNHPVGGGGWEFEGSTAPPSEAYCEKFYNRVIDLIDKYDPDLLYFDDSGLPLHNNSDAGLRIAAHYYNASIQRHHGKLEAVLNTKGLNDTQRKCMVLDFERGKNSTIDPSPWQTDTCIGGWHYDRSLFLNHGYKKPDEVIKMLLDIVSKNGNLLLNIPVRGDGTWDQDEIDFLNGMAAWMAVNEEAIFSSRPWKIAEEGPSKLRGGAFSEGGEAALGAKDFRFTTKGNVLYAAAMGWPADGKLVVRTLAGQSSGIVGAVTKVTLLGSGPVTYQETGDGLIVTLPATPPCDHAYVLKIEGLDLDKSMPQPPPPPPVPAVQAAADGSYLLTPDSAIISGKQQVQHAAVENIGYWDDAADSLSWKVQFQKAGVYAVTVKASAQDGDSSITVDDGAGASATTAIANTGSWDTYQSFAGGTLNVAEAGVHTLTVKPTSPTAWKAINIAAMEIKPQ